MSQKAETRFRVNRIDPFLLALENTHAMSIQQVSIVGDPDKILCMNGKFVAMEIKDTGKKPDDLQALKLDLIERAGGIALVATPENWDLVNRVLLNLDTFPNYQHSPKWREFLL